MSCTFPTVFTRVRYSLFTLAFTHTVCLVCTTAGVSLPGVLCRGGAFYPGGHSTLRQCLLCTTAGVSLPGVLCRGGGGGGGGHSTLGVIPPFDSVFFAPLQGFPCLGSFAGGGGGHSTLGVIPPFDSVFFAPLQGFPCLGPLQGGGGAFYPGGHSTLRQCLLCTSRGFLAWGPLQGGHSTLGVIPPFDSVFFAPLQGFPCLESFADVCSCVKHHFRETVSNHLRCRRFPL